MSRTKLNILLLTGINYNYIPPEIEMPIYLASFGHNVIAIFQGEKFIQCTPQLHSLKNCRIIVVPYKKIFHIFNYISYLKHLLKEEGGFDIVFASRSLLNGFASLFLKSIGVRTVFIMENPIEQGWVSRRFKATNKIHKLFIDILYIFKRHFLLFILRNVDLVVAISHGIKQDIMQHKIPRKVVVIPEGVQVSKFIYISKNEINDVLEKYNVNSSTLITYIGSLDRLRNLTVLIRAFSIVISKRKKIKLMLVGDGDDVAFLKRLVAQLGISSNVIFTGWVDPQNIPKIIAASDICVSIIPPFSFYRASCPIKIHEYLAAGKPVVANEEIPEQLKVISESRGGILTTYNHEAIALAIMKIIDNPQEALKMGENGREWITKNRSYDILVQHIERICFKLLKERGRQ